MSGIDCLPSIKTYIIICALFCNHLIAPGNITPEIELTEAAKRLLNFSNQLLGSCFTNEDEKLFALGAKVSDVNLTLDEIIPKYGYVLEKYEVTTEDGYILTLFRIPSSGRPLLLMHGLMLSADEWVTPGPDSGIAYLLADEGYDVWIGNARGNKHSRRHLHLSPDSAEFWDFSWDEMGRYDLPAIIDFVLNTTCYSQLTYIGHSQGTTSFFVMLTERLEYNDKISLMVGLAPASMIPNIQSPLLLFLKHISFMMPHTLFNILRKLGFNEFIVPKAIIDLFVNTVCGKSNIVRAICRSVALFIGGFNCAQVNVTTLPVVLSHLTSGASMKQLEHYAQTAIYQKFQRFNYGAETNRHLYGSATPPEYNMGDIKIPIALIYGPNDWLTSITDTHKLRRKLKNVIDFYRIPDEHFNHLDFFVGKYVKRIVYPRIYKIIKGFIV